MAKDLWHDSWSHQQDYSIKSTMTKLDITV